VAAHLANRGDVRLDDQQAYIELADGIQLRGGIIPLWEGLRSGDFDEANRHPLYPILLSYRPTEGFGRGLSVSIGLLTLTVSTLLVARKFSPMAAGLFAILLASNGSFGEYATSVVCESLMILLGGLAYFALLPPRGAAHSSGIPRVLVAAALLGLMYLTKATGLVYFGAFVIWLAWECRPRRSTDLPTPPGETQPLLRLDQPYQFRRMILVIVGAIAVFLIVAQPLIERNVRRFGNPFYNVNSLLLFADRYEEFEQMLRSRMSTPTALTKYVENHTVGEMIWREVSGLAWEAFIMLRALGPMGLNDARVLVGIPLALCCLVSLIADNRPAATLLLVWVAAAWIVFAWYVPIAAGDRFAIPLLLPLLAHAADGMVRLTALCWPGVPTSFRSPAQRTSGISAS
jgi:hypothetical protein